MCLHYLKAGGYIHLQCKLVWKLNMTVHKSSCIQSWIQQWYFSVLWQTHHVMGEHVNNPFSVCVCVCGQLMLWHFSCPWGTSCFRMLCFLHDGHDQNKSRMYSSYPYKKKSEAWGTNLAEVVHNTSCPLLNIHALQYTNTKWLWQKKTKE